jgi:hypothetical protein
MRQFTIKHILASFVWFGLALLIVAEQIEIGRYAQEAYDKYQIYICFIPSKIPPLLVFPFSGAGLLTLFGRIRAALIMGIPAVLYAGYSFWNWYQERLEMGLL